MKSSTIPQVGWKESLPLGFIFYNLSRSYYGTLALSLNELDIDRHFTTLIAISEMEGPVCQQDIANTLSIDKTNMVRILDHLSDKGYITRERHAADRRSHCISLTTKAIETLKLIKKQIHWLNESCKNEIDEKEWLHFMKVIEKMGKNLDALPKEHIKFTYRRSGKNSEKTND